MTVPDPDAVDDPPRADLDRSSLQPEPLEDDGPTTSERDACETGADASATIDRYPATATIDGEEWRFRVSEPRLQGFQTSGDLAAVTARLEAWAAVDDHPLVARVVDWGVDDGVVWVASEHGDAPTLADRIAAGSIEPVEAVWLARNLCGVVGYVGSDVPSPIAVDPARVRFRAVSGSWDLPRVIEPGLALLLDSLVPSPQRHERRDAAPERYRPADLGDPGEPADVYRIGAICYELLTGRPPFELRPIDRIATATPPAPTDCDPGLPSVADDVLRRALEPDPDDRHWTVDSLERDLATLAEALEGEPV